MGRTVGGCDAGMRGVNCDFDVSQYFTITAVIWILTALPLLAWATPCLRRQWSASRAARASLLFAAASTILCFVDGLLASVEAGYGKQTLSTLGSILLVFAIRAFSTAWCDVASATCVVHARDESWGRLITRVRLTYKWMPLVHVPFALMFSIHDYCYVLPPHLAASVNWTMMLMYGVWLAFGTLVVLSGLAFVQWYIARACFDHVDGARGLQHTALINMVQQLFFDLIIAVYIVLYASDTTNEGDHIAAYHYLAFIAFWGMHLQVVLLFAVLGNTDPLYSQDEFASLLKAAAGSTDQKLPTKIGSPCGKGDGVAATDV